MIKSYVYVYMYLLMSLICLQDVTKKLVGTTYFVFYGPDRTIVKQGRDASFLGFVLKGRLIAYETRQDQYIDKPVTEVRKYLEPGDTFGEIPLLYNIPWLYTIVTDSKYR